MGNHCLEKRRKIMTKKEKNAISYIMIALSIMLIIVGCWTFNKADEIIGAILMGIATIPVMTAVEIILPKGESLFKSRGN